MECLEALLEFGADPGATSANGDTPLARAKAACVLVRACVLRADVAYSFSVLRMHSAVLVWA